MLTLYPQRGQLRMVLLRTLTLLLLVSCTFRVLAQEDIKPTFGVIDKASLQMKVCPGDSSADAMFLYDYGETTFGYEANRGIFIKTKIWARIKIFKESGLDQGNILLTYYEGAKTGAKEKLDDISGVVYNLDGNEIVTTKLDQSTIQTEKSAEGYLTRKFNLPNVKKGSVIEYSYTRFTPFLVSATPKAWPFQGSIPIQWSEYKVTIPSFIEYHITFGGYLPFYINESEVVDMKFGLKMLEGKSTSYRLVVKDAPAFVNEPFITTSDDYISKVSFEPSAYKIAGFIGEEFAGTWDQIDWKFRKAALFGEEINAPVFGKEIPEQLLDNAASPKDKMNVGYSYIQKTMKWDEGVALMPASDIKKAYQNRKGNSAAVNLLLINLLRKAGLDCDPVVLSTRSHGKVFKDFPTLENFNYVIARVMVDSVAYLLDATQKFARPGVLPEYALNGFGRVIPKVYQGHFIDIIPKDANSTLVMVDAEFLPEDGKLKGKYSASLGGYEALDWREDFASEPDKKYLEAFQKEFSEWSIKNLTVSNKTEKLDAPVSVKCEFETESESMSPGTYYFDPITAGKMKENPLKSSERIYPLDFTTLVATSFIGTFRLPEGYFIEEMPKAEVITLPGNSARFLYQAKQDGNVIQVTSKVSINKIKFLPEEYHDLKEFFDRVVTKHAQPLVIKKK
ncbi:DUF3857 domain-containing protein [Dyadobacter luticola]|uniref:DUF3857 domain-containing protein n=1 Tax=Dyadobacter luticola TaxID=1979387 RepID=A0A5R9KW36_9BACT|nr:DUF3857 domain-containing protein [Dyadobacter luticola]TLV00473.1 DUF3857 domain-containing protein [Dyadobacter luticola]